MQAVWVGVVLVWRWSLTRVVDLFTSVGKLVDLFTVNIRYNIVNFDTCNTWKLEEDLREYFPNAYCSRQGIVVMLDFSNFERYKLPINFKTGNNVQMKNKTNNRISEHISTVIWFWSIRSSSKYLHVRWIGITGIIKSIFACRGQMPLTAGVSTRRPKMTW